MQVGIYVEGDTQIPMSTFLKISHSYIKCITSLIRERFNDKVSDLLRVSVLLKDRLSPSDATTAAILHNMGQVMNLSYNDLMDEWRILKR